MVNMTQLDNGVRIITEKSEQFQTISLGYWLANSTTEEPQDRSGISHFIEHLLFKGTNRRDARQISGEIDSIGGIINAFTSHEYVCYYSKFISKFLPRVSDILTDIFLHSVFPPQEIERERNVVLQEIKMRDDSPDEAIHDRMHQHLWRGTPLGKSILGDEEIIRSLSRDTIVEHWKSRYRPEDIIIAAAGNIEHQELVSLVSQDFGELKSEWKPEKVASVITKDCSINKREREMEQTLLLLGVEALPFNHPDRFALHILTTILGGGMSSRLFQEIREKRALAYSVYAYTLLHSDSGGIGFYLGSDENRCREAFDAIIDELKKIKNEPVSDVELDAAREQVKGKLLMSLESSDALMTRLAKNIIHFGCNHRVEKTVDAFNAVTAKDLQRVAQKLFNGDSMKLELLGKTQNVNIDASCLKL